jgi:hypothetical protein
VGLLLLMSQGPPTIVSQPQDQTSPQGQVATFTVVARDARSFQWSVSSDNGFSFEELNEATNASYTTPSLVYPDDNGKQFRVVIRNTTGTIASRAAVLTVTSETLPDIPGGE